MGTRWPACACPTWWPRSAPTPVGTRCGRAWAIRTTRTCWACSCRSPRRGPSGWRATTRAHRSRSATATRRATSPLWRPPRGHWRRRGCCWPKTASAWSPLPARGGCCRTNRLPTHRAARPVATMRTAMRPLGLVIVATVLSGLLAACVAAAPAAPSASAPPAKPAAAAAAEAPPAASAPVAPASQAAGAPPTPVEIRYGQVGVSAATWLMYIGEAEALFDREGVQVDKNTFANGNAVVQALASGSIDTASVGADLTVLAVEQGAQLSIIAGGYNRLVYTLVAQPSIGSVRDLAGKLLGVGGLKTSDALTVRRMLRHFGLNDDDYDLTAAATTADRFAALKSNIVAAAVLTQPTDFQALDEGF